MMVCDYCLGTKGGVSQYIIDLHVLDTLNRVDLCMTCRNKMLESLTSTAKSLITKEAIEARDDAKN